MADDEKITQDELDNLKREAEKATQAAGSTDASAGSAKADGLDLNQDEIDSLLNANGGEAEKEAVATAAPATPGAGAGRTPHPVEKAGDDIQLLIDQAAAAAESIGTPSQSSVPATPYQLSPFSGTPPNTEKATLELFRNVNLDLKIELGRTHMHLEDVLKLRQGSVVTLEKLTGDPVNVYANGRLIARGEVLVLNDNFCVRIAQLISSEEVQ